LNNERSSLSEATNALSGHDVAREEEQQNSSMSRQAEVGISHGESREDEEEQREGERRRSSLSRQVETRASQGERREDEEEQREGERRRSSLSRQVETRASQVERREDEEEQREGERRRSSLSRQVETRASQVERREDEEEQREGERRRSSLSRQVETRASQGESEDEAVERRRPSLSRQVETRVSRGESEEEQNDGERRRSSLSRLVETRASQGKSEEEAVDRIRPSSSRQGETRASQVERREEEEEQREDERRRPSLSSQTEMRVSRAERREEEEEAVERRRPSLSRQTETRVSQSQDQKSSVSLPKNESRNQQQVASSSRLSKHNQLSHHRRIGEDSNINVNAMAHAGHPESQERAYDPYKKFGNITVTRDVTRTSNRKKRESNEENQTQSGHFMDAINISDSKDNAMQTKAKIHDANQYRGDSESKSESNNEKPELFSPRKKKLAKRISMKTAQEISDAAKAVPKGSQGLPKVLNHEGKNLGSSIHRIPWVPCKVILNCFRMFVCMVKLQVFIFYFFPLRLLNLFGRFIRSCSGLIPLQYKRIAY
jgi:hypothetical protein